MYLQLHLITSYPPANLNRDDVGRPKTAQMGGFERLRVSSQSLKRAWRTSSVFESALSGHLGTRTKEIGNQVMSKLLEKGVDEKNALKWARSIAGKFGDVSKKEDAAKTGQLVHISPEEWEGVFALVDAIAASKNAPTDEELELLRKQHSAVDIALFGRMLASEPAYNMEAAAQVAHAISVHKVVIEDDFFTAVDDLNDGQEDVGAGHMGETEFAAGLFYLYLCIDRDLLLSNLGGDKTLANKALAALVEASATVAPSGKQNSFASRARASYILAETGKQAPRSLSVAFLKPVSPGKDGMLSMAIDALNTSRDKMSRVYGACSDAEHCINAETGEGELSALLEFVQIAQA